MANFAYKGRDGAGKAVEGVLEGINSGAIADQLVGRGITPLSIKETRAKAANAPSGGIEIKLFAPRVQHIDLLFFSRQLHTLLKAGVPIMRGLAGLQESAINPA